MKLIPNWRAAIGHYSTIALGLVAAVPSLWAANPEIHVFVPADKMATVTGIIAVAGIVGKFVRQAGSEQ